jgi:hypothetical protein
LGTHVVTITAKDAAGNTGTATTTFTVVGGGLTFSVSVSPDNVDRGRAAKVEIHYHNNTADKLFLSYVLRYAGPCDSGVVESGGPLPLNGRSERTVNAQFRTASDACIGQYTLTVETYVEGVLIGTASTQVTVVPSPMTAGTKPGRGRR